MPFKFWRVEESYEDDPPRTNYVFPEEGLELVCHGDDSVGTIFLESERFDEFLLGFPFSLSRRQVIERFGHPTRSGAKHTDETLGEYGAWDRFGGAVVRLHIQYWPDADKIKRVTLMRPDVAP